LEYGSPIWSPAISETSTTLSYKEDVSPVFNTFDESNDYKLAKKAIHTRFVEKAINNYKSNLVLGRAPPPVKDGGGGGAIIPLPTLKPLYFEKLPH